MILTDKEKSAVDCLESDERLMFDDEARGVYQFEVEKISQEGSYQQNAENIR